MRAKGRNLETDRDPFLAVGNITFLLFCTVAAYTVYYTVLNTQPNHSAT